MAAIPVTLLSILLSMLAVDARIPGVYSGGQWQSAHATFYGGSDASGTMGTLSLISPQLDFSIECCVFSSFLYRKPCYEWLFESIERELCVFGPNVVFTFSWTFSLENLVVNEIISFELIDRELCICFKCCVCFSSTVSLSGKPSYEWTFELIERELRIFSSIE